MFKRQSLDLLSSSQSLHQLVHKILGWIVAGGMVLIGSVMIIYGKWSGFGYVVLGVTLLPVIDIPLNYRLAIAALGVVCLH